MRPTGSYQVQVRPRPGLEHGMIAEDGSVGRYARAESHRFAEALRTET